MKKLYAKKMPYEKCCIKKQKDIKMNAMWELNM